MKKQSGIASLALFGLFFLLISKIAFSQNDTAFIFSKPNRAEVKMVVDGFYYVNTEDFDDYGGWKMDNQFVHLMGSPYLIATGVGEPVQDAKTSVNILKEGEYYVWVRARNWEKDYAPGRFEIFLDGKQLNKEFGAAPTDKWTWENGGKVKLKKGNVDIALHDITGYYGRCDAIILTDDGNYIPPINTEKVCVERARLKGLSLEPNFAGEFDVIVVGGGSAGVPAALAAARMGAKTALIQNRPVLGGNCSKELGVPVKGAGFSNSGWRETGIIEEAELLRMRMNQNHNSDAFKLLCDNEENLEVFYNQHVFDAVMKNDKQIEGVKAVSTLTGKITEYEGTKFIDCTGDGWLGYFAGAEYRYGRESKDEFNESLAPDTADSITMSGCIMGGDMAGFGTAFRSTKTDKPVEFVRPSWVQEIDKLIGYGRRIHSLESFERGNWWMEHEGTVNDLWDAEEARDELIKISLSYWDYVKNKNDRWNFVKTDISKEEIRYLKLVAIPIMDARRETRRLVGDYVLTQHDVISDRNFSDRITYGGWPLDVHHPKGIFSGEEGSFEFDLFIPVYTIPFRSTYSKNIDNLLFAGRCGSFTHLGLGSPRVQATLATMGQAAGTAAAMCIEKNINPRDIYKNHISELQQTLLKNDQSIPGIINEDSKDLARDAKITASSYQTEEETSPEDFILSKSISIGMNDNSVLIPCTDIRKFQKIRLYPLTKNKQATSVEFLVKGIKEGSGAEQITEISRHSFDIPAHTKRWIGIPVDNIIPEDFDYLKIELPNVKGLSWPILRWFGEATNPVIEPADYMPENTINGSTRLKENSKSLWVSDPLLPFPQWMELDFGKRTAFNTIQLTFDTDLSSANPENIRQKVCVKSYKLSALIKGEWGDLAESENNFQRHRIHNFKKVRADKLRLTIRETNGAPSARVFEIRVYNE